MTAFLVSPSMILHSRLEYCMRCATTTDLSRAEKPKPIPMIGRIREIEITSPKSTHTHAHTRTHTYKHTHIQARTYTHICIRTYIHISTHANVCIHIYMYIYIAYIHTYTHIQTQKQLTVLITEWHCGRQGA